MGLLQEGRWVDKWYNTKDTVDVSCAGLPSFGTGSRRTAHLVRAVKVASRLRLGAIISMFRWPVPGAPDADFPRSERAKI